MANDDKISETVSEGINGSSEPEKVVEKVEPVEKVETVEKVEPVEKVLKVESNGSPNPTLSLSEREEFVVMKAVLDSRQGKALYLDYLEKETGR